MNRKGFTLTELMIVIAILGILSSIAIPMYRGYISNSKKGEAKANLETIRLLEEQFFADSRTYLAGADTIALTNATTGLPGFQPERDPNNSTDPFHRLHYTYKVEAVSTSNIATSFKATAIPKATAPSGNLTIDESNNKTGW